jgi:parvulin-like peptidyl-prolyl isomerase
MILHRLFLISALLLLCSAATAQTSKTKSSSSGRFNFLPEVIAEVNQQKITRDTMVKTLRQQLTDEELAQFSQAQIKSCLREIVNEIIDRLIITKMLAAENIVPSAELVLSEFRKNFAKLSPEQQAIAIKKFSDKSITIAEYEKNISSDPKEQFRVATLLWAEKKFADEIKISDEQLENYYRQNQDIFAFPAMVTLSQILIRSGKNAKDRAETALSRLHQGEDFGKVAAEFSDCETSKLHGGYLGKFRADGTLLPEIQDAAFTMKAGSTSGIITVDKVGYVILHINSKIDSGYLSLSDTAIMIRNRLQEQIMKKKIQELLLKERSNMKINLNI